MRSLILLLAFASILTLTLPTLGGPADNPFGGVWRLLPLPFKMFRLSMRPPDTVLQMPVQGVKVGQVANTWGAARPGDRHHQGQDIFARRGTPVVSATYGIVVRIGDAGIGGKSVSVLGAGGRTYYYAHLDGYAEGLRVGTIVQAGDVLGQVGNTGNARTTPPHLHFGVYERSGAVDPLRLLRPPTGP